MSRSESVTPMLVKQQYCTFTLNEQCYGFNVLKVQEIIRSQPLTRVPLSHPMVQGLINLRGQIVTAIDLKKCLGLPASAVSTEGINVVLHTSDGAVSLIVDEVGDVLELGEEQFEAPPNTLLGPSRKFILGVFKLADRLLIILDPDQIVALRPPAK